MVDENFSNTKAYKKIDLVVLVVSKEMENCRETLWVLRVLIVECKRSLFSYLEYLVRAIAVR